MHKCNNSNYFHCFQLVSQPSVDIKTVLSRLMERLSNYTASSTEVLPEFLQVEAFSRLNHAIGKVSFVYKPFQIGRPKKGAKEQNLVTKYLIWDEHWILWSSIFLVIVVEVLFSVGNWKFPISKALKIQEILLFSL